MFHCFLGACKIVVEHCCYLQPKSIAPVCMFMKVICRLIVNIVLWGNVIMNGKNSQWNFLHIEKWAYFACIAAFWEILYWITPFFCFTRTVSLSMKYIYISSSFGIHVCFRCIISAHQSLSFPMNLATSSPCSSGLYALLSTLTATSSSSPTHPSSTSLSGPIPAFWRYTKVS